MKSILCWTLANLWEAAGRNPPTPREEELFGLAGWRGAGWFHTHSEQWGAWFESRYSEEGAHTKDSFWTGAACGAVGVATQPYIAWAVLTGELPSPGDLCEFVAGDYCSGIYPPILPTPPKTPGRTPPETPWCTAAHTPRETPRASPVETPRESPRETPQESPAPTPWETPAETPEPTPQQTPKPTPTPVAVAGTAWVEPNTAICRETLALRTIQQVCSAQRLAEGIDLTAFRPFAGCADAGILYTAYTVDMTEASAKKYRAASYTATPGSCTQQRENLAVVTTGNQALRGTYTEFSCEGHRVLVPSWMSASFSITVRGIDAALSYAEPTPEDACAQGDWFVVYAATLPKDSTTATAQYNTTRGTRGTCQIQLLDSSGEAMTFSVLNPNTNPGYYHTSLTALPRRPQLSVQSIAVNYTYYIARTPATLTVQCDTDLAGAAFAENLTEQWLDLSWSWLGQSTTGPTSVSLPPNGGHKNAYIASGLDWGSAEQADFSGTMPRLLAAPIFTEEPTPPQPTEEPHSQKQGGIALQASLAAAGAVLVVTATALAAYRHHHAQQNEPLASYSYTTYTSFS